MTNTITKYQLASALVVMMLSCSEKEMDTAGPSFLTAQLEQAETRAAFDDTQGKLSWTSGDAVAVHVGNVYVTSAVTPENGHLTVTETTASYRNYFAVYPASVADASNYGNPTLKVNLPSIYDITDIVAGTSAKTVDYAPLPMVAVNDNDNSILRFFHAGGLLRIMCNGVPAGTRSIAVTMDKGITGSFRVDVSDPQSPAIVAAIAAEGNNTVTYNVSSSGLSSDTDIVLNVPIPCGYYSHVNIKTYASGTTPTLEKDYDVALSFQRHHGKKLALDLDE